MKNKILKFTAIAAILLSMVSGMGSAFADAVTSSVTNATASITPVQPGNALAVPAGYTVLPPNDSDRSDDQIVQLENLTIRNISGSIPGTIYASRDMGGACREYMDVSGRSGSKIYPCPMAPSVLYQVSVQSDTILLLKDRSRASISDLAIGDRINVFGFLDRGTSGVQALIVRDLDKPAAASQYVQLNGLTVIEEPNASNPPATFKAARKGMEPCLYFQSASPRGMPIACPMGVDVSTSAEILSGPSAAMYRSFREYYSIQVTGATQLLGFSRARIGLQDIKAGDQVNVYGRYIPGSRTIEAVIVRDLSVSNMGQPSLIVLVTDKDIVCITTPCGQVDGLRVDVHVLDFEGDDTPVLVASGYTSRGQTIFRNLKPGRYLVTASGTGYQDAGQEVVMRGSETARVDLAVSGSQAQNKITLISPNGSETIRIGDKVRVKWDLASELSLSTNEHALVLSLLEESSPEDSEGAVIATLNPESADGSYEWNVQHAIVGGDAAISIAPGNYGLKISLYDGQPCFGMCVMPMKPVNLLAVDASDRMFSIKAR